MRTNATAVSWRISSFSGGTGDCVQVAQIVDGVKWRKGSRSNGAGGECVEIADAGTCVAVRDSKAPDTGYLAFTSQVWAVFMAEARAGRYNR